MPGTTRILLLITTLAAAAPAVAEGVQLTRGQVLAVALDALNAGEAEKTLALAEAVLKVHPEDVQALILKARALRDLGRFDAAQQAAQAAWALAGTDSARFGAAMAMGQALSSGGQRTMAQFWLRRAFDNARSEGERRLAAQGYQYVKAQNPLAFQVSFGFAPNSNINNGSSADVIWIGSLPFTPIVYSGYTAEASAGVTYRFSGADGSQTYLGLQGYALVNWLDAESQAVMDGNANPDDTPHDFDYVVAAGTVRHVRNLAGGAVLDLNASAGRSWYGWAPYADFVNAGVEIRLPVSESDQIALFAKGRGEFYADPADAPVYTFEAGGRYAYALAGGDRITLTLAGTGAWSDTATQEYLGARAAADYSLGAPVFGAELTIGATAAYRDYPVSAFDPAGRQDWRLGASLEAAFPQISAMGFIPVLSAEVARTYSNIPAFQSDAVRIGFELRSQF